MSHNYGDDSPIAAFATTPGNSALTLIRCTGKDSIQMLASVFVSVKTKDASFLADTPGNTVVHGWIVEAMNNEQGTENREKRTEKREKRKENREEGIEDREQRTENREQGTGNREEGIEDREQRTENREQGIGNREEGIEDREQRIGKREQRTENREQGREKKVIGKIDEVLVSVFRAPKSYTGEDSLDICCHGGVSAGKAVMTALKNAGFRDALPGEFTFRAFMNGKLDLTRCESVMEIVNAKTETGRSHAVSRLSGSLQKEINDIKNQLVQVLSGAEIYLDYSEDEISADADEAAGKLPGKDIALETLARLKKLSASWQLERIYQEGITLVIAGRPNAGKSSLFNSLLKEDRSIVTEIPGTTRDWIEAWVSIEGIPIRLIDTAGLRETDNSVEKIGVERSRELLQEADIVLYLIDGTQGITEEDFIECGVKSVECGVTSVECGVTSVECGVWSEECGVKSEECGMTNVKCGMTNVECGGRGKGKRVLYLWNKCDVVSMPSPFPLTGVSPIGVSAKTGEGFTELYSAIVSGLSLHEYDRQASAGLGTERQKNLVDAACSALEEALILADRDEPLDVIAPLLRDAVNSLGEVTGEVSTADILEEMFSRFCVGK